MQELYLLVNINALFINFIIAEILISLILVKKGNGWKIRFGGQRGFNPYIKSWKATIIMMLLAVIGIPILMTLFWSLLTSFLEKFSWSLILLLISTFSFTFVWILTNLIGKKWERIHTFSSVICVAFFVFFIIINL